MIPDFAYTSKSLYTSNQVGFKFICLLFSLVAAGLHIRDFYHLVNTMIFINENANIYIRQNS